MHQLGDDGPMTGPSSDTLAAYREGVEAIEAAGARIGEQGWDSPACGVWTAYDLAGHLEAVARWYHEWLDRALAGNRRPPFSMAELDAQNQVALRALPTSSGPERVGAFAMLARSYAERISAAWEVPYGFPG